MRKLTDVIEPANASLDLARIKVRQFRDWPYTGALREAEHKVACELLVGLHGSVLGLPAGPERSAIRRIIFKGDR